MIKLHCKNGLLVAGTIAAVLLSSGVQAANCTLDNWSAVEGLVATDVGTPASGKRRYAGPCGLRVPLAGAQAYVQDTSPVSEETYNVRFYFFLDNVADDVTMFKAETADNGSGVDVISATYDAAVQKINVVFSIGIADGNTTDTVTTGVVSSGWNSLEIQWASAAATKPKVILNGNAAVEPLNNLDTSNHKIELAKLGAVSAPAIVPTGGSIDFDDFDSRRDTVPGRLLVGDANGDGATDGDDQSSIVNEFLLGQYSDGNPDCNQDGEVNGDDQSCIINIFLFGSDS